MKKSPIIIATLGVVFAAAWFVDYELGPSPKIAALRRCVPTISAVPEPDDPATFFAGNYNQRKTMRDGPTPISAIVSTLYLFPDSRYLYVNWRNIKIASIDESGRWAYQKGLIKLRAEKRRLGNWRTFESIFLPFFSQSKDRKVLRLIDLQYAYDDLLSQPVLHRDERLSLFTLTLSAPITPQEGPDLYKDFEDQNRSVEQWSRRSSFR